jgi:gliding motility-associated-like protein
MPDNTKPSQSKYYVSASVDGCESARARIDVNVYNCCGSEIIIPNAFSPNGDRHNDAFGIIAGVAGTGVDYIIYNRWGQQVFHGIGNEKWNGMDGGKPAPIGTYYYLVRIDCRNGTEQLKKGELELVR